MTAVKELGSTHRLLEAAEGAHRLLNPSAAEGSVELTHRLLDPSAAEWAVQLTYPELRLLDVSAAEGLTWSVELKLRLLKPSAAQWSVELRQPDLRLLKPSAAEGMFYWQPALVHFSAH